LLHEDPYTHRAFTQPRGYAGDAVLIDYLYKVGPTAEELANLAPTGREVLRVAVDMPSGHSVRRRRDMAADLIEQAASEAPSPHILSVGCGHLREAVLSHAVSHGRVSRFVALDQDLQTIRLVSRELGRYGVEALCSPIASLIARGLKIGAFDLVYSMGLLDYLGTSEAERLAHVLFEMLKPGGRLVLANFVPDIVEVGYMEAFMRWHLTYRTPIELYYLCEVLPRNDVGRAEVVLDDFGNIAYLSVVRT
jgi:SAM-dependent methyltransferase